MHEVLLCDARSLQQTTHTHHPIVHPRFPSLAGVGTGQASERGDIIDNDPDHRSDTTTRIDWQDETIDHGRQQRAKDKAGTIIERQDQIEHHWV